MTEIFTFQELSWCRMDNEPENEQVYSHLFYTNVGDYDGRLHNGMLQLSQ